MFGAFARLFQSCQLVLYRCFLGFEFPVIALGQQTDFMARAAQAQIGVVLAEQQTILGAGGEHPVRLNRAFGDQIINQHTDISLVPAKDDWRAIPGPGGRR